jgi:hypothetical protein
MHLEVYCGFVLIPYHELILSCDVFWARLRYLGVHIVGSRNTTGVLHPCAHLQTFQCALASRYVKHTFFRVCEAADVYIWVISFSAVVAGCLVSALLCSLDFTGSLRPNGPGRLAEASRGRTTLQQVSKFPLK